MPVFLSPARRGRGILVAPGFCPASGFLVGAKTQNLPVNFFFNFNMTFLATWGCASDFLRCYQNSISPPEVNSKIFDFLKVSLKFKMPATVQLEFFGGR